MEREKRTSKILIKTGSFISGLGAFSIAEGLLTQHGELGSIGAFLGGAGAVIIFTGIRRKK
jgi:hypothetical protein